MNVIKYLRLYHATLAITALLAYITGELGIIHAWLGYGVALIIVMRLIWAMSGVSQLGLSKFYPSFEGMRLNNALTHPAISHTLLAGIALSVIAVTITGIMMDEGKSIGLAEIKMITPALADDNEGYGERDESFLSESHEFLANLMLLFVGMHVSYLILFKRPLALFMLFVPKQDKK
jgi:cytochrome b